MEISITGNKTLRNIQSEFQSSFPFLKIEFYKEFHTGNKTAPDNIKWHPDLSIAEIRKSGKEDILLINDIMKVAELENEFASKFGITVQVFRKSGNLWIQTTKSDNWTLAQQNEAGQHTNEEF